MALNTKEEKTLLKEIEVLKELPIERIRVVLVDQQHQEVSSLYKPCKKIEISQEGLKESEQIIEEMTRVLKRYREITGMGRALSANQIGINKAVVIFLDQDGSVTPFLNPKIIWRSKKKNVYWEMCISGTPLGVDVIRSESIKVRWFDLDGTQHVKLFESFDARRMQHEIDHLDGRVCYDTERTIHSTLGYALDPQSYMNQTLRLFEEDK